MQPGQTYSQWSDWAQADCTHMFDASDLAAVFEGDLSAFNKIIDNLQSFGLPAGAVVEIEFAVRRRESAMTH